VALGLLLPWWFAGCSKRTNVGSAPLAKSARAVVGSASVSPAAAKPSAAPVVAEALPSPRKDQGWAPEQYAPALEEEAEKLFNRELMVARRAVTEKRFDDALKHYTKALSTGRSDAQCLGERGYVRLLRNELDAATDDLWLAAGAMGSDRALAQVWYNLGLAWAQRSQPDLARAALARSLAFAPSKQAETKLGQQSRCQASVLRQDALGESAAQIVSGWLGVHKFLDASGEPKTEAEARELACSTKSESNFAAAGPEPGCTDPPPWVMSCCGTLGGFLARYMLVYPRPNNRFFAIDFGTIGAWPHECQGAAMPEASVYGRHLVLKTVAGSIGPNADFDPKRMPDSDEQPCRSGPVERTFEIYDLDTAKRVLEVSSLDRDAAKLEVNAAGTQATLSGAGCDATLSLP